MVHVTWTCPFLGSFVIIGLWLATINLPTKFEVSISANYEDTTRVPAASDGPTRHSGWTHAKYSIQHHMVIKPFHLFGLAADYTSRRWVSSIVSDNHQKFVTLTTLTGELSWPRLKSSAVPEIWLVSTWPNHVLFRDGSQRPQKVKKGGGGQREGAHGDRGSVSL